MRRNPTTELKEKILLLEKKRAAELSLLKEGVHRNIENLNPANALKEAFSRNNHSPIIFDKFLSAVLGLFSGFLVKKIIIGSSKNIFRQALGLFVQLAITGFISKNSRWIQAAGNYVKMNFDRDKVPHKKTVPDN